MRLLRKNYHKKTVLIYILNKQTFIKIRKINKRIFTNSNKCIFTKILVTHIKQFYTIVLS